jgi:hypothetical protein
MKSKHSYEAKISEESRKFVLKASDTRTKVLEELSPSIRADVKLK